MKPESKPNPAPSILVVDDTPANLHLLTEMLKAQGFRVRPVPSGELALQTARLEPPDLILLDINMPGLNGFEVCQRLKAEEALRAIPVIYISALGGVEDKLNAFRVGGVDYVAKPFQFEEVEARVRTHLELARLRRELEQHNARLEEMVAQRTRELVAATARLTILDQAKSDFLQLIAHELRTPLCGVFTVSELLLAHAAQDPLTADYAGLYDRSRRRLMTLLEDALLLTQIGTSAQPGTSTPCELGKLLEAARAQAAPLAQARRVALEPAPPNLGRVPGTADYLARALQSLLETAVKFARAGTTVHVAATAAAGEIRLRMEAEGRTIPPHMLPRFFDLLAITEPITPGGDLGLAPALAERILTLYGATVSVENLEPPGIGLLVRFRLCAEGDKATENST